MNDIHTMRIFNAVEVAISDSESSYAINLNTRKINGYFSIQIAVTGDGTLKLEVEESNDNGATYIVPVDLSEIVTGFTKTSGPGSDGKAFYEFEVIPAKHIRIKASETGGANSVTLTGDLVIH